MTSSNSTEIDFILEIEVSMRDHAWVSRNIRSGKMEKRDESPRFDK